MPVSKIPEINSFDISVKKIHQKSSSVHKKAGQGTDISVCVLSGCCFHEQLTFRMNIWNYSMGVRKCQWILVQQKIISWPNLWAAKDSESDRCNAAGWLQSYRIQQACVSDVFDTDEPVDVQLLCHSSVMRYLIDNFGTDFEYEVIDDDHFKATVNACTSSTFYRWVFGFIGKIRILAPQNVLAEYKDMLRKALNEE